MSRNGNAAKAGISIVDDVEKNEKEVLETLLKLPDGASCRIYINSGGGSVYSGLGIATLIEMKRLRATAIVLADCSSSALLIFASCSERLVAPHASFLFHPMQWASDERSRLTGATGWAREFKRIDVVCSDWLCSRLKISKKVYQSWVKQEIYVTAKEMAELGIASYAPWVEHPDLAHEEPSRALRPKTAKLHVVRSKARMAPAAHRYRARKKSD